MTDLNDFFKTMAEGKKNTPKTRAKIIEEQVKENIRSDFASLLSELSSLGKKEEPVLTEEVIVEAKPISTPIGEVPLEVQTPAVNDLPAIDKYLKSPAFSEPKKPEVDLAREMDTLSKKFKFLEQWVGKINNAGPGSGVAEIYNLDIPARTVTGDYHIGRKDYYIGVNCDVKSYIHLPVEGENLKTGRVVVVKDESGHAQLTPIKIVGTIDNDPNGAEIRINNGALQLLYSNGSWRII